MLKKHGNFIIVPIILGLLASCGSKPVLHVHTYSQEWTTNETHHWHAATCEHSDLKDNEEAHIFNAGNTCAICGYTKPLPPEPGQLVKKTSTKLGNEMVYRYAPNTSKDVKITISREKNILQTGLNSLHYNGQIAAGDLITFESNYKFLNVTLDNNSSLIYCPTGIFVYQIPDLNSETCYYSEDWGYKTSYFFSANVASDSEVYNSSRNLLLNFHDHQFNNEILDQTQEIIAEIDSSAVKEEIVTGYPHAYSNRVTRNEANFYARNAIDGKTDNSSHGKYPYHSWGYDQKTDAALTIYFGRNVKLSSLIFTLRNDTSVDKSGNIHDTYWKTAKIEFSDKSYHIFDFEKTGSKQTFIFPEIITNSIRISEITTYQIDKCQGYAALTEIEGYGAEIEGNGLAIKKYTVSKFGGKELNKASTTKYSASEVENIIDMANDWFVNITETTKYTQPDYNDKSMSVKLDDSKWKDAVYYGALCDYYNTKGGLQNFVLLNGMFNSFNYLVNAGYNTPHGDYAQVGEGYLYLYDSIGGSNRIKDVIRNADYCINRTDPNDLPTDGLCKSYDKKKSDWTNMCFWWCDALYMTLNTYTLLYTLTGNENYVKKAYDGYLYHKNKLYNTTYDLWFRDIDQVSLKTTSGLPLFWSRGNAWVVCALAKQLLYLDETKFPTIYESYKEDFVKMMSSLIKYQRADGLWDSSIIDHSYFAGKESTGSSGYLYALCTGLELGVLDSAAYLPAAEKCYEGLLTTLLKDNDGQYTGQPGYQQTTGYQPQNYKSEEHSKTITTEFGMGLFILGMSSFMRLCNDYSSIENPVYYNAR